MSLENQILKFKNLCEKVIPIYKCIIFRNPCKLIVEFSKNINLSLLHNMKLS